MNKLITYLNLISDFKKKYGSFKKNIELRSENRINQKTFIDFNPFPPRDDWRMMIKCEKQRS